MKGIKRLRKKVREILLEGIEHRCLDGSMVPSESEECYNDILNRISDAEYHRNGHTCGTENRVYYNGLLKGLRKKRNSLRKTLGIG